MILWACVPNPQQSARPGVRTDVGLLDVKLVFKPGRRENALADERPTEAMLGDTVGVYPVVQLTTGDKTKDTVYLANTTRIARVGASGDTIGPGWPIQGRLSIWSKLKNLVKIEWYEVRPAKSHYRKGEKISYRLAPLAAQGWYQEFTGPLGSRRLVVRAQVGKQSVSSSYVGSEDAVSRIPWMTFRQDTTSTGWTFALLGAVPYREGSSSGKTRQLISYDSRTLVAYGLAHAGYQLSSDISTRELDSIGRPVFQGYIKFGRLYDQQGRRADLLLGRDLRRGDVIRFLTLKTSGVVADERPRSGWSYGGIPARLPIISAGPGFPKIRPLYSMLWSLKTLWGRAYIKILRYDPIPQPPPPKVRRKPAPQPGPGAASKSKTPKPPATKSDAKQTKNR
jgi:hypothetical protein